MTSKNLSAQLGNICFYNSTADLVDKVSRQVIADRGTARKLKEIAQDAINELRDKEGECDELHRELERVTMERDDLLYEVERLRSEQDLIEI